MDVLEMSPAAVVGGGIATALLVILIIALPVFMTVCRWKIFTKQGEPGWAIFVPIYNKYVYFKIAFGNGLMFLLLLIPLASFVITIVARFKFVKAYDKGAGFALGMIFFPIIFMPLLAYGE